MPLWVIITRVTKFIKISSLLENGERKTERKRGRERKRKIQRVREKGWKRGGREGRDRVKERGKERGKRKTVERNRDKDGIIETQRQRKRVKMNFYGK